MSILDWLFNRSASCAALRAECSLYERQVSCMRDDLEASREACGSHAEEAQALRAQADEGDGLMRKLWMERRRNDELRARIALTDANAKCCFAAMAKQEQDLRAWINRLLKDIELQKQRRIEAQAELETLKGKGSTSL